MSREVTLLKAEQHANVIIRPNTFDVNLKDMKQALLCIERGEQATLEKMLHIKRMLEE